MTTVPAMFEHSCKVFERMKAEADENGVYEGFVTRLVFGLDIPVPYYGKILKVLSKMGCIEQNRRGGGKAPSRWTIYKDPTVEEFLAAMGQIKDELDPVDERFESIEQQLRDIRQNLSGVNVKELAQDVNLLKAAE